MHLIPVLACAATTSQNDGHADAIFCMLLTCNNKGVPFQEGLEEPESFCRLMMTNTIEDLLDPVRRAQIPSGFNYKRLVLILAKYRCRSALSTPASSGQAET